MTLAFTIRCADGLVMASDSRVTGGPRQSADISEKFLQVNRDVGIMTFGLAIPGYRGIRALVEEARQNPSRYTTMTSITRRAQTLIQGVHRRFISQLQRQRGGVPPDVLLQGVGFILAGFDGNDTAQFRVYSCSSDQGFQFEEQIGPVFMAAQWHLPSWLFPLFAYPGMSVQHGLKLAVMLMMLTSAFERTVGGPIHIATVTLDEGFTLLHEREVASLVQAVQPYLLSAKRGWLEAWQLP